MFGDVAVGLHGLEEASDVLTLASRLGARFLRQAGEEARGLQEAVEHLAGAQARHVGHRASRSARRWDAASRAPRRCRPAPRSPAGRAAPRAAAGVLRRAYWLRRSRSVSGAGRARTGEVEERDRVVRAREHAQEGDEQTHLLAGVEAAAAAEAVRDALHVQGAQEGVGVAVAAHEDRDVARTEARASRSSTSAATPSASAETVSKCKWRTAGRPAAASAGACRCRPRLEPVRVVVGDEARGRVQDQLGRAVVLGQHHLARPRVEPAEGEQVRGRRAAPAIDGLVVVAHHRDVARPSPARSRSSSSWAWFVSWNSSTRM